VNIIVSRTDKAGDLILTSPMFRELRRQFPDARIIAHVKHYTASLIRLCPEVNEVLVDDDYPSILALSKAFRDCAADMIIIVHPAARVILAAFLAGIVRRVGRASNVWQFFLSDRRVQKRSRNEKHEFQYNLQLLEGLVSNINLSGPSFVPGPADQSAAREIFSKLKVKKPVLIHPGHGGSAHNLSPESYAEIAQQLISAGFEILVSLGPGEEKMSGAFADCRKEQLDFLKNVPDFAVLAAVMQWCRAFIGGSTGPMHLAAAVGLPVLAFFPPVPAMTPKRWGPVAQKNLVLMPSVESCTTRCNQCKLMPCMGAIDLSRALAWLVEVLKE